MSKCVWVDYIYKLMLMLVGAGLVTPGMGKASNIPHFYFNWTRDNTRFQAEGGARITVPINTNLVIKCPYLTNPPEYYRIYWVSEQGYRDCFRPHNDSKLLVDCTSPNNYTEWTQEIKDFTGVPGGKDFTVGKSYFLATFSTGTQNGLKNEIGGACQDYRLKLNVTIIEKPTTPEPTGKPASTTRRPITPSPRPTTKTTSPTTSSTTTGTTTPSTTIKQTSQRPHIPSSTPAPVISVPSEGNTGVIDITNAQVTLQASWALALSLCLSLLHILYLHVPNIQR